MAQTSDRVSSIAAQLMNIEVADIIDAASEPAKALALRNDIRSVAASAVRNDETKGSRFMKLIGLGPKSA